MKIYLFLSLFCLLFILACKQNDSQVSKQHEALSENLSDSAQGILYIVDQPPHLASCDSLTEKDARKYCTDQKLLSYVHDHMVYPQYASEHGIEGRVVVTFVVETDGRLSNIKALHDIGGGTGEASVKVIEGMNQDIKWVPGILADKKVRVRMNLPVTFKLTAPSPKK